MGGDARGVILCNSGRAHLAPHKDIVNRAGLEPFREKYLMRRLMVRWRKAMWTAAGGCKERLCRTGVFNYLWLVEESH